jgi:hypothetical protein
MRRTVAFERIASEPEVLDRDMTPADIAAALQRLRFGYNRRQLVALDEEVRDFLLAAVTPGRAGGRGDRSPLPASLNSPPP